jgi:hypothetical protein
MSVAAAVLRADLIVALQKEIILGSLGAVLPKPCPGRARGSKCAAGYSDAQLTPQEFCSTIEIVYRLVSLWDSHAWPIPVFTKECYVRRAG